MRLVVRAVLAVCLIAATAFLAVALESVFLGIVGLVTVTVFIDHWLDAVHAKLPELTLSELQLPEPDDPDDYRGRTLKFPGA